jgi:putative DNA primase/helicase
MFFILQGNGKNGKSTLLNAVADVFDGMGVNVQPETLNGKMDGNIRNDLARLAGKRLLMTSETKGGTILDAPLMKQITGGDMLTARKLYHEPFEFKPVCVPIIVTNFLPVVDGSDFAMERRVCVITFDTKIANADTKLQTKLKEEKSGIFNLLLDGLKDYQSNGLDIPASVAAKTKKFTEGSNLIKDFILECLEVDNNRGVRASELYQSYSRWTTENGCRPMSMPQFKTTFERETGIEQERTSGGKVWKGYIIKHSKPWVSVAVVPVRGIRV